MEQRKSAEAQGGVAVPGEQVIEPVDGHCPVCGGVEPHRHCVNCQDVLAYDDEQGHLMQSGVFMCSPSGESDRGVHVAV